MVHFLAAVDLAEFGPAMLLPHITAVAFFFLFGRVRAVDYDNKLIISD